MPTFNMYRVNKDGEVDVAVCDEFSRTHMTESNWCTTEAKAKEAAPAKGGGKTSDSGSSGIKSGSAKIGSSKGGAK